MFLTASNMATIEQAARVESPLCKTPPGYSLTDEKMHDRQSGLLDIDLLGLKRREVRDAIGILSFAEDDA